MSIRNLRVTFVACLGGVEPVSSVAAQIIVPLAATGNYLTPGRLWAMVATAFGLVGMIIGGRARARSAREGGRGSSRKAASVALTAAMVGLTIGGVVVAAADGGPGTGYGIVGGFVAIGVGLVAALLASLTLIRRPHGSA